MTWRSGRCLICMRQCEILACPSPRFRMCIRDDRRIDAQCGATRAQVGPPPVLDRLDQIDELAKRLTTMNKCIAHDRWKFTKTTLEQNRGRLGKRKLCDRK